MTSINSMQTSCFFVHQYLISTTSITGGIGGSDFLSSQFSASSGQISFSLVFFRMRVSGSRQMYSLLVESLGILFHYWTRKSKFNYFMVTEKEFV